MRRPLLAGNWKMNHVAEDGLRFVHHLPALREAHPSVELALFPPATLVMLLARALSGTQVRVGGQTCHAEPRGAFTGELSAAMLADAGCELVLVGHSERRTLHAETDADTGRKVAAALAAGLDPILCVGETLTEREEQQTEAVIVRQLEAGLIGVEGEEAARVTLAYEPVWAIGSGRAATPQVASEVHALIRAHVARLHGTALADGTRILYGGSLTPANARGLLHAPDVDGGLVGGASLDPRTFGELVAAADPEGQ